MNTRTHSPLSRLMVLLLALVALLALPSAATAHDELVGTNPKDGAVVATAPKDLRLEFSNDLMQLGAEISVTAPPGATGEAVEGQPEVKGRTVVQRLNPGLTQGTHTVAWRVVSSDGHPIGGTFRFSVGQATAGQEGPATAKEEGSGTIAWVMAGLGILVVVALTALLLMVRRRSLAVEDNESGTTPDQSPRG